MALGLSGASASAQPPTPEQSRARTFPQPQTRAQTQSQAQSTVRINEIESSGGTPGDWVELVNTGSASADVSRWIVKDDDDSHTYTIASGTLLAPGGHLVLDVESSFGLGSSDSVRLLRPDSSTPVDSYTWTAHATTTYGRCADGAGPFTTTSAPTRGTANACGGQSPGTGTRWPGDATVTVADRSNAFGTNLSGLSFQSPDVLWAVKNGPGRLYRLVPDGTTWRPDPAGGWSSGKALRYGNGGGDPDAEGVAVTPDGVFVATERDNDHGGVSLPKILRFDVSSTAASLNATAEWNLTADLPAVPANSGPEGIAWVPDTYLTVHGFHDEHTGGAYDPAAYPDHGGGLFFVGLEANGTVYAYALNRTGGGYTRVATFPSGFPAVMDLEFEPETGRLWAVCDNTCAGRAATLGIDTRGRFTVTAVYDRPAAMPDHNNEGFAIAPRAACAAGRKPVLWSDDDNDDKHALRAGTLPCTPSATSTTAPGTR
ncbi:lamin tail domain-containing protein [Streptomyces sp. DT24]|uniref:lamin tail domain-containing protein n=1 Tax=Streptomyces sp. DT24 TaxID=3416520 RepID=UPI003CE77AF2